MVRPTMPTARGIQTSAADIAQLVDEALALDGEDFQLSNRVDALRLFQTCSLATIKAAVDSVLSWRLNAHNPVVNALICLGCDGGLDGAPLLRAYWGQWPPTSQYELLNAVLVMVHQPVVWRFEEIGEVITEQHHKLFAAQPALARSWHELFLGHDVVRLLSSQHEWEAKFRAAVRHSSPAVILAASRMLALPSLHRRPGSIGVAAPLVVLLDLGRAVGCSSEHLVEFACSYLLPFSTQADLAAIARARAGAGAVHERPER